VNILKLNRFVKIGQEVKMIKISNKSIAIDTKNDLNKNGKLIK
jgi:CMP-2-keto-3-deoxyoctulosonic acid synthetase